MALGDQAANGPILVLGGAGLLGCSLLRELETRGQSCLGPGRDELDLRQDDLEAAVVEARPGAVINVAAFSDVTQAERPDRLDEVLGLNRDAPIALARACHRLAIPLLHVSTDYVFDGELDRPYREDDETRPLQVYGRSKLLGEQGALAAHERTLIVRTSTLFGPGRRRRPHYVDAILAQARERASIRVVRLPIASPTYAPDLARGMLDLLAAESLGRVHLVSSGVASRAELAREAVRLAGLDCAVEESPSSAQPTEPRRPRYSVLDTSRFVDLCGAALRPWQEALEDYLGA